MKKLLVLICAFVMAHVHAQELSSNKVLLQTVLNSMDETYGNLIQEAKEYKRQIDQSLPLVGKKKKAAKAACLLIENTTSDATFMLEETGREIQFIDVPSDLAVEFETRLVGVIKDSKKASRSCLELEQAIAYLESANKNLQDALDILNKI